MSNTANVIDIDYSVWDKWVFETVGPIASSSDTYLYDDRMLLQKPKVVTSTQYIAQ